jgi:hypothetical protein
VFLISLPHYLQCNGGVPDTELVFFTTPQLLCDETGLHQNADIQVCGDRAGPTLHRGQLKVFITSLLISTHSHLNVISGSL